MFWLALLAISFLMSPLAVPARFVDTVMHRLADRRRGNLCGRHNQCRPPLLGA